MDKLSFSQINEYFKKQGYKLYEIKRKYSDKAKRNRLYCVYLCDCGKKLTSRFNGFKNTISVCKSCSEGKRIQTNFKKYGCKVPSQNPEIKKKQSKNSLARAPKAKIARYNTMMEKYGVGYTLQIDGMVERVKSTMMKRYGVPSGAYLISPCSKESQNVFWKIHNKLPKNISKKNHFAKLNAEFVACRNGQYFKYDFVNSILKKCIEYNGQRFHPQKQQKDDEIGWCVFHPNKTVKEARKYEKEKYLVLEIRGYKILTIWDYEYKKLPQKTIKKCMDFLLG